MDTSRSKKSKIVALIPARGGSKSIPYKNIKKIGGRPLVYWALSAAKKSKYIDSVYLSSENEKIKKVVRSLKLNIQIIDRPMRFASDAASTESVMFDFAKKVNFDILITLQATSPLTTEHDIDKAVEQFIKNKNDSMVTGVTSKRFYWSKNGNPINYNYLRRPRRQTFNGIIMENGAFYITKRGILEKYRNRLGGRIGVFEMPQETACEIDEPEDWKIVEALLNNRKRRNIKDKLKGVKIILSDFDGVWTDNKVYADSQGNEMLFFSKEDSLGLDIFRKKTCIPLLIISKERNQIVKNRCKKLKLKTLVGIDNKMKIAEEELAKIRLRWSDVCYIGNDLNDIECIKKAGVSFCPADANSTVKKRVDYVSSKPGGNGAIREILDLFL